MVECIKIRRVVKQNTNIMIDSRQYSLSEDLIERPLQKFNDGGWVTISGERKS